MMFVRGATVVAAAVLAVGCGPQEVEEPGATPPPSSGLPPTSMPPPAGSNGLCHDLSAAGVPLVVDQRATAVPPLTGGSMADGRYVLTRYEWYTPNQLHTRTIVLVISGGGQYGQYLWQRNQEPEQRMTVAITTQGDRLSMATTCPTGEILEWDRYSINEAGLTLFSTRDSKAAFLARM
jgi:hypothetical protein